MAQFPVTIPPAYEDVAKAACKRFHPIPVDENGNPLWSEEANVKKDVIDHLKRRVYMYRRDMAAGAVMQEDVAS